MNIRKAWKDFLTVMNLRKLVWELVVAGIIITGLSLTLYFITFHGGLAATDSPWGSFGSYIGGILGPFFSLFTLVGVLYTLYDQGRKLRESRKREREEATAREITYSLELIDRRLLQRSDSGEVPARDLRAVSS